MKNTTAFILCNGKSISKSLFKKFESKYDFDLICADGGANTAYKMNLKPKIIIGDFDSAEEFVLNFYKSIAKLVYLKRQTDTDLEKALLYCRRKKYNNVFVFGFSGKRFDHTLSNISNALKFSNCFRIVLVDDYSTLQFINGEKKINSYSGEIVSLFGMSNRTSISTVNLKYPLNREKLIFGIRESTSNVSTHNNFVIHVHSGIVALIRSVSNFLKYD